MDDFGLNNLAITVLVTIIPIIVAWLLKDVLGILKGFLKDYLTDRFKTDKAAMYVDRLDEIVAESVLMVSQTFVTTLKEYGKFDAVAQRTAFERAKANIEVLINDEGRELLMDIYGDLDQLIRTKIEANVITFKG